MVTPDDTLATRARRLGRARLDWRFRRLVGEDGEDDADGAGAPIAKRTLPTRFSVLLSTLSSCEAFGELCGGGDGARGSSTLRGAMKNVSVHIGRIRFGGPGGFFGYAGAGDNGRVGGALEEEVTMVVVKVILVVTRCVPCSGSGR